MESIIVAILKNLGRDEEANAIVKTSAETQANLELRMNMKRKDQFEYWRFSTALKSASLGETSNMNKKG